jgi:hypothetical protein
MTKHTWDEISAIIRQSIAAEAERDAAIARAEAATARADKLEKTLRSLVDNLAEGDFISETRLDAAIAALEPKP